MAIVVHLEIVGLFTHVRLKLVLLSFKCFLCRLFAEAHLLELLLKLEDFLDLLFTKFVHLFLGFRCTLLHELLNFRMFRRDFLFNLFS